MTIAAGAGTVSFEYADTTVGTPTLTAAASGLTSATQVETVNPIVASQLAFTTAPQTLTAGVVSNTITVALEDAFGNPIDATSTLTVNLSTTSAAGTFTPVSPLTILAGASQVSFTYTDTIEGFPTLTAAASGLASATQQETVNAAVASQLVFSTAPQTLTVGVASNTITVELEDAFGNPADASSDLTVNVSTTSAGGTFTPASPLTIPAGLAQVSFTYTDTEQGTPTLTAAATGLTSATQQETVVTVAAASQLAFSTAPQTLTAGVASNTITVTLEDASGNPVDASSGLTVTLSTTSAGGTFTPASPLTIPAGASQVSFTYTDTIDGTPTLTAAATGLTSAMQQETVVTVAVASQLAFSTAPQTLTAGVASNTITVTLEDASGNPADASSSLTVNLSTTSAAGTFMPVSPLTIPAGASQVSFTYTDTIEGTPTLTAVATGLTSATQMETVNPAVASQLAFTTKPQTLIVGTPSQTVTIALEDAFGNLVDSISGLTVNLNTTSAGGTFTPASPLTISAGASQVSFTYTDTVQGTPTLTAAATGLTSATQQETVNSAVASQLAFTTAPQTLTAGVASNTITITLENASGNPVDASGAVTVNVTTTSEAGTFMPLPPLTIPAGASQVSFTYTDTNQGTPTLTATATGLASATQQETVNPAAASQLVFTTAPQTLTAGVASKTIIVLLEDAFGNPVDAGSTLTVNVSTTSAAGTFTPVPPLTIPAGDSHVSFTYTDTKQGTPMLTVAASGLTSASQQETVNPAVASQLAFTTAPQTLSAGVASNTITVALEDAFGNPVDASSALTVNVSTTSAGGTFTPQSPLTIPAGASQVSFTYADTNQGTPTLTATTTGLTSATQMETVNAAVAASQLAFTTAVQILTAGVASTTITVTLEDASGNPVDASSALTVTLSTTSAGGTFTPVSPVTIPAGASQVSFTYTDTKEGTPTLTAATSGLTSATQVEIVNAAVASQLVFSTVAQTLTAGVASSTITVELEDAYGNTVDASSGLTVTLSTTSAGGTFTPASPLTIPAGLAQVSFTYTDSDQGTPTLTAAASGLTSATQQETVNAAPAENNSGLSGYVYDDANYNYAEQIGQREISAGVYHVGIPDVTITLVPADTAIPEQTTLTQSNGYFQFNSLPAGAYTLVESQPPQYLNVKDVQAGSLGGDASVANTISNINLPAGQTGTEYDFGEWLLAPGYLSKRLALASTPTAADLIAQEILDPPPVVQLGGSAMDYASSYVAGGSPAYIAPAATITHAGGELASLTVTIANLEDGNSEGFVVAGQTIAAGAAAADAHQFPEDQRGLCGRCAHPDGRRLGRRLSERPAIDSIRGYRRVTRHRPAGHYRGGQRCDCRKRHGHDHIDRHDFVVRRGEPGPSLRGFCDASLACRPGPAKR